MSPGKIPDQMTAVVLDSYTGADALRVEQRPVPRLGPNQVLVKVAAAIKEYQHQMTGGKILLRSGMAQAAP